MKLICCASLALVAAVFGQSQDDPAIMTDNGNVVVKGDNVVFEVSPPGANASSFSITSVVNDIRANRADADERLSIATTHRAVLDQRMTWAESNRTVSDAIQSEISTTVGNLARDLGTFSTEFTESLSTQIAAIGIEVTTALDGLSQEVQTNVSRAMVAASSVRLPMSTSTEGIQCTAAHTGLMSFIKTADGCNRVVLCNGAALTEVSFTGPAAGVAACNPSSGCREAVDAAGRGGTFWVGNATNHGQVTCDASGLEAGNGTVTSPGISCASIFTNFPALRNRGKQTYKMQNPAGHVNPGAFSSSPCTGEGGNCVCRGTGTRKMVRYGASPRFAYRILRPGNTQSIRCTNSEFGDPWPGRGKRCYCGVAVTAPRDVVCDPRFDSRITTAGLVGWWKAENYNIVGFSEEWPSINPRVDLSHLSNSGSLPVITAVARVSNPTGLSRGYGGNMAHATYDSLQSVTSPSMQIPANRGFPNPGRRGTQISFGRIPTNYGVCTTSRYLAGGRTGRIFVGSTGNWLHGHWNGRTAVVHYDRWVTYRSRGMRYDWVVSCTTYAGAQTHYINGGVEWKMWPVRTRGNNREVGIGLGTWQNREQSHYAFGEVLLWNRPLSASQLRNAALYLTARLSNRQ